MKIAYISEMWRGWFIGNFEPSVLQTNDFEVAILTHKKDEKWSKHYHAIATEYNVLISGTMTIQNELIQPGTIFILYPHEIADPIFHEDCVIVCIKTPSVPGDKYEVF
jgi:mannose-6-phosphate isomerase-like protein (cupin superfamily)